MKNTLFYLMLVLSVFAALAGCKKAVDPTVPGPVVTPNETQTIEALIGVIGGANATSTQQAAQTQTCVVSSYTPTGTPTNTQTPDYSSLVQVPGGTFIQTSFSHTISAFKIGKYEVTYGLWYTVYQWAISNGYTFANAGSEGDAGIIGAAPTAGNHMPVTTVNWRDMIVWNNAYSQKSGLTPVYFTDAGFTAVLKDSTNGAYGASINTAPGSFDDPYIDWSANGYRLPTEGEWQYAASYMDGVSWTPSNYASGAAEDCFDSTATERVAWFIHNSGYTINTVGTRAAGTRAANGLGICDMSGNVAELCGDWYGTYPGASTDYRGPSIGALPYRIMRGGNFINDPNLMAVDMRVFNSPFSRSGTIGFRFARTN